MQGDEAIKAACIQAAGAAWASDRLSKELTNLNAPEAAESIAQFAALIYQAWAKQQL